MSAKTLIAQLEAKGLKLAIAESITGGLLSSELVSVPGASKVVLGSIVAYQTGLKSSALGVGSQLLEERGPVDPEVAIEMAEGIRSRLSLQLLISTDKVIGVSTTGVAGPDEQDGKPVGMVFIAVAGVRGVKVWAEELSGDRNQIRASAASQAILHVEEYLAG